MFISLLKKNIEIMQCLGRAISKNERKRWEAYLEMIEPHKNLGSMKAHSN